MKKSKQAYYEYFETNWNKVWESTVASSAPTVLSLDNGDAITNLYDIANTINSYFSSLAETTKIKHTKFP